MKLAHDALGDGMGGLLDFDYVSGGIRVCEYVVCSMGLMNGPGPASRMIL